MCKENGFSLIEVSVASLIIMLGVTGYVTLQSEYVVTDTKLNLRGVALNLAQEKLTDLAYFQRLRYVEGVSSFQTIANNLGGTIPAGESKVVLSTQEHLQTYTTQWEVENLYYVDTNFDGVADTWVKPGSPFFPVELPRNAHLKNVHVMVTWLDTNGDTKQIDMFGSIAPIEQSQSFQTKYRSSSALAEP
ncbi:hypothetical protein [uncultured Paraglaciecola sp.]|uniref:type IV pilus modification PilV family protein n=1 Tax=uncultured Paraglaciecola sp. TaxID=1765024 RepID=UPI0030DA950F|tara:strand:+ start:179994 stop:180563 length:570 start_codon:yes stop_codon:yes gene_type:complete